MMPTIVGEILSGVFLGPTILGFLCPSIFSSVFASSVVTSGPRHLMANIGLFLFLFLAGLEVSCYAMKRCAKATIWVSILGMLLPFSMGLSAVIMQPRWWSQYSEIESVPFAIFLGAALSISALPVIARILMDLKVMKSDMASIVMTAATFDDLVGWSVFSVLLWWKHSDVCLKEFVPLVTFWAGVIAAPHLRKMKRTRHVLSACTMYFFAPIYFISIGLDTNFVSNFDGVLVSCILMMACAGKIVGVLLGGWISRMVDKEIYVIAFAMNARGAMGILLASLALEMHLIREPLFVALVCMAIVTSILAGPMIRTVLNSAIKVIV